jgi:hypothetical protein
MRPKTTSLKLFTELYNAFSVYLESDLIEWQGGMNKVLWDKYSFFSNGRMLECETFWKENKEKILKLRVNSESEIKQLFTEKYVNPNLINILNKNINEAFNKCYFIIEKHQLLKRSKCKSSLILKQIMIEIEKVSKEFNKLSKEYKIDEIITHKCIHSIPFPPEPTKETPSTSPQGTSR